MKVRELIEALQKEDQELEVKIHPDQELFLDEGLTAYGDVGFIEEDELYFDESRNCYHNKKDFEEFLEEDFGDIYETENANDWHLQNYKNERYAKAEKLHALFIRASV